MFHASRAVTLNATLGQPLPQIGALRDMYKNGNQIYRGGLHMVAGRPKAMKSMFMLWYAQQMNVNTLYFSADSDAPTMTSRMLAAANNKPAGQIRDELADPEGRYFYGEQLEDSNIFFSFNPSPEIADIEDTVSAYVEMFDRFPDLLVVDNLMDVYTGLDSEFRGYKESLSRLKDLTRMMGCATVVLHHMKESDGWRDKAHAEDNLYPAAASAIQGKVGQTPSMVLSVARDVNMFRAAVVYDRNGDCDSTGKTFFELTVDPATCRFEYYAPIADRWVAPQPQNPGVSPAEEGYYQ